MKHECNYPKEWNAGAVAEKSFDKVYRPKSCWLNTFAANFLFYIFNPVSSVLKTNLIMTSPNLQVVHVEIGVIRAHKVAKSRKRGIIFINK